MPGYVRLKRGLQGREKTFSLLRNGQLIHYYMTHVYRVEPADCRVDFRHGIRFGGNSVIYDHRTYICRPGTIKKHMKLYEEHGWSVQSRHLGKPLLYGSVETGDVNSYVHIWVFESAADRAAKRAALQADPDWQAYLAKSAEAGYLIKQENKILVPAPFFEG